MEKRRLDIREALPVGDHVSITLEGDVAVWPITIYWDGVHYSLERLTSQTGQAAKREGNTLVLPLLCAGSHLTIEYWVKSTLAATSTTLDTAIQSTAGVCQKLRFIVHNCVPFSVISSSKTLAMSAEHLKTDWRSRIMRDTDTKEALVISGRLSEWRSFSAFALTGLNISPAGFVQLKLYRHDTQIPQQGKFRWGVDPWGVNRDLTLVYATEKLSVSQQLPQGKFRWGVDPWGATEKGLVNPTFTHFFDEQFANYWELIIHDPANSHVDVRQFFLGDALTLDNNFSYGLQYSWECHQQFQRTEGGSLLTIGNDQVWRVLSVPFDFLTDADREKLSHQRRNYPRNSIFVSLYPEGSETDQQEFALPCKFKPPAFQHSAFNTWETSLELVEI